MDSLKGLGDKKPFHVRMPNSLRSTLETSAKLANRSLNAHIGLLLEGSISAFPIIEMAPAITEALSKNPFGIRVQDSLKADIQLAAQKCGRSINTEIVIRLLMAAGVNRPDVEIRPLPVQAKIEADLIVTWERLNKAIEALLCADVFGFSKAASELRDAKKEYERLVQLKLLAMNTNTALANR